MGWAAKTRTCPLMSSSTIRSDCRSMASRTGRPASCRRSTRGHGSARPARPSSTSSPTWTARPIAALLRALKRLGLLSETLVVWGGEFGRLPIAQLPADKDERKAGRDHNKNAFSTWMAGAGVKGGVTHGATDELGLAAVENRVSVPDWHATILRLLGLRYDQLFFEEK